MQTAFPRRVIVIGAGAIGAAVGALLFRVGVPVVLVAGGRRGVGDHARALRDAGVDLRFPDAARPLTPPTRVPTVSSVAEAAVTVEDLVLLATMGQDTPAAVQDLDPAVGVASFQNGLEPLDMLVARRHPTLAAMVYIPAERRGPGVIALPGVPVVGSVFLGQWGAPSGPVGASAGVDLVSWTAWLCDRLRAAGLRAEAEPDIAPWIRAKLLTNLGGIVVALCDDPPFDLIEAAVAEACAVWTAAGEPFETVEALITRVGPLSTALVDGRPRVGGSTRSALARGDALETASLHGSIVRAAHALGIPVPVNEALIRIAAEAVRDRVVPGSMPPEELRRRLREPRPDGQA